MGKELFVHRRIHEDIRILEEEYRRHDGCDLLMEQWLWNGIRGKSIIFLTRQVGGLSDFTVEDLAREIADLAPFDPITLKREESFTYVTYRFRP